ncbi:hypothetical protein CGLO_05730 [Colletotrichum gloeosporioides Cg-14]|uniref:Histone H1 n=1 Tax=Colletotrichum gloeosporioides (strain Cg-14) TaxID=1237896 RepID=T0M112_COLGC|nr:hypothetical protein CGLO_05730 [Colletotrichum gloeosporioides Cg-14]
MPPKKTEGAAAAPKKASHPSYQDMITEAIVASGLACATGSQYPRQRPPPSRTLIAPPLAFVCLAANHLVCRPFTDSSFLLQLKERNGSSRQALKKYVKANNQINVVSDTMFDSLFNKALRAGVEKGVFEQPKGPSGGTKLAKKAPKKEEKKAAPKKAAEKKEAKEPKEKKAAAPRRPPLRRRRLRSLLPRRPYDKPAAISKTKTGRVTKTEAKKPAAKKAAAKKDEAKAEPAAASA